MDSVHKHIILYVEDDEDDLFLAQQAFEQYSKKTILVHASNGFEALEKLNSLERLGQLPCLIVLDINMPGLNGKEALVRIKQSPKWKDIPAVLFSTSCSEDDRDFARRWDAQFITKPLMYAELEEMARIFLRLCETHVQL